MSPSYPFRSLLGFLAAAVLLAGGIVPAEAWWREGHSVIADAAIEALPDPLKAHFEAHRELIKSLSADEPPGAHYIDIDYYPEFHAGTFPRDLDDLIAVHGSSVVFQYGIGPWTAGDYYDELVTGFAYATTSADWTALLDTAGALAHYIQDLHNPMHLTTNYNGQFTDQYGIHSRFEGTLVERALAAGVLQPSAAAEDCVYYPSMVDAILDDIEAAHPHNRTILAADLSAYAAAGDRSSAAYYSWLWEYGCDEILLAVMDRATAMVAGAWYSAWRDAGFPQPYGVAPSTNVVLRIDPWTDAGGALSVHGDAGQSLVLQTSGTMTAWADQRVFTNLDGRTRIELPDAPDPVRFYRVSTGPGPGP